MASYFGEVLPLRSRAVDDDDEEFDVVIPELSLEVSDMVKNVLHSEVIIFAVGRDASVFAEAYLIADDSKSEIARIKRVSCSDTDDDSFIGLNYNKYPEILGYLNRLSCSPNSYIAVFPHDVPAEQSIPLFQKIINMLSHGTTPRVLIMTGSHISNYKALRPPEDVNIPFLRMLASSHCSSLTLDCPYLEQPNMVTGLAAAALTECEVREIPAVLYICYSDISDAHSSVMELFQNVFKTSSVIDNIRLNTDFSVRLKRILLRRHQDHGNLYI